MICKYCAKPILEGDKHTLEDTLAVCSDCGVSEKPETPNPDKPTDANLQQAAMDLARCFKELQFVRLKQIANGETDDVILKRPLTEILLMMESSLNTSKHEVFQLNPTAGLRARYHMLCAVVYGLAYLSTHPAP